MNKKTIDLCDCSPTKQKESTNKISYRNAWEAKWFGLLYLVPSGRTVLALILSTRILILCFNAFLARWLLNAVDLVQAGATNYTLISIFSTKFSGSAVRTLGQGNNWRDGITCTCCARCIQRELVSVLAYLTICADYRRWIWMNFVVKSGSDRTP